MHELSIAESLIELVCEHARREGATRIRAIDLRLGELSGFRRALYFCFEAVARGTACEGARLTIEEVPLTLHCGHCDAVVRPRARYSFRCPTCGMPTSEVVTGREMQVVSIELEFAEEQTAAQIAPGARQARPSQGPNHGPSQGSEAQA